MKLVKTTHNHTWKEPSLEPSFMFWCIIFRLPLSPPMVCTSIQNDDLMLIGSWKLTLSEMMCSRTNFTIG